MQVEDISFKEIVKALKNEDGRKIVANYGLDPKLGKYRAYLVYVGIPLSGFAILCFYDGFAPSLLN